jgi:hypothetical protein
LTRFALGATKEDTAGSSLQISACTESVHLKLSDPDSESIRRNFAVVRSDPGSCSWPEMSSSATRMLVSSTDQSPEKGKMFWDDRPGCGFFLTKSQILDYRLFWEWAATDSLQWLRNEGLSGGRNCSAFHRWSPSVPLLSCRAEKLSRPNRRCIDTLGWLFGSDN